MDSIFRDSLYTLCNFVFFCVCLCFYCLLLFVYVDIYRAEVSMKVNSLIFEVLFICF